MNNLQKIMFDRVQAGIITDDVWFSFCLTFMADMIQNDVDLTAMFYRMKNGQYQ